MLVLTVCNLKGGSGKTTSSAALGFELARRGHRVLLVDLDPQASLTMTLGADPGPSATQFLSSDRSNSAVAPGLLVRTFDTDAGDVTVDVLPSDRSLMRMERARPAALAARLEALWSDVRSDTDIVLIDPPPTSGSLVLGSFLASDGVIVPVAVGRGALEGVGDTLQLIEEIGSSPVRAVFATRVNSSAIHDRDTVAYLTEQLGAISDGGLALSNHVRETVRVREAEMAGQPITFYDAGSTAGRDYRAVADELEAHVFESPAISKPEPIR